MRAKLTVTRSGPPPGVTIRLTGGAIEPAISNGNSWQESVVSDDPNDPTPCADGSCGRGSDWPNCMVGCVCVSV